MRYELELCEESGAYWLGQDFLEKMNGKLGKQLKTDIDWKRDYVHYLDSVDPERARIFEEAVNRGIQLRRGIAPIETVALRFGFDDAIIQYTEGHRRIVPLNIYNFNAEKPRKDYEPVVRISDLAQINPKDNCILTPYLHRKELVEIDEDIRRKITKGKLIHEFALTDPFTYNDGKTEPYDDFLDYYFLNEDKPQRREQYCEKPFLFSLDGIEIHATPDSSFLIEDTGVVVNADLKFAVPPGFGVHKRYSRSLCGYHLGYKTLGFENSVGVVTYLRPLRYGFSLESTKFSDELLAQTRQFLLDMGYWFPLFEEDPENILIYVDSHLGQVHSCKTCKQTNSGIIENLISQKV